MSTLVGVSGVWASAAPVTTTLNGKPLPTSDTRDGSSAPMNVVPKGVNGTRSEASKPAAAAEVPTHHPAMPTTPWFPAAEGTPNSGFPLAWPPFATSVAAPLGGDGVPVHPDWHPRGGGTLRGVTGVESAFAVARTGTGEIPAAGAAASAYKGDSPPRPSSLHSMRDAAVSAPPPVVSPAGHGVSLAQHFSEMSLSQPPPLFPPRSAPKMPTDVSLTQPAPGFSFAHVRPVTVPQPPAPAPARTPAPTPDATPQATPSQGNCNLIVNYLGEMTSSQLRVCESAGAAAWVNATIRQSCAYM